MRRASEQTGELSVLRSHEHDIPWMIRGIGGRRAMASATGTEVDDSRVQSFRVCCLRERGRATERQHDAKRDEREVAIEQHRAVDGGERAELFDDAFGLCQERA